ncbi:MAG: malectin domain-containing carbohydrate-binding protein [Candidatus Binatia bacterium]|nr:malectin domain-containing carbohydrate-binding protein [Candidatus Binatia bacterium]
MGRKIVLVVASVLVSAVTESGTTEAGQLRLSWTDRSTSESGFQIERKTGQSGTFGLLAVTAANATTYTDANVTAGVTYCYRVRAFNASAVSPYSNEACGTVSATTTSTTVWAVNAGGPRYTAPDGTVYQADTAFSGGSTYTTTAAIAATEEDPLYQSERYGNFSYAVPLASGSYTVEFKFAEIYHAAANKRIFDVRAEGKEVISNLDLFARVGKNTAYNVAVPVSVTDGTLNLSFHTDVDNAKVSAIRVVRTSTKALAATDDVSPVSTGEGAADPLSPWAAEPTAVVRGVRIGVFRPATGAWYIDRNGNGLWDGCAVDGCLGPFGQQGDLPLVGNWTGNGKGSIGVITSATGLWQLDVNGNGVFDGCADDACAGPFGEPGDLPVVGNWIDRASVTLGVFTPGTGTWRLDTNGNGVFDGCGVDRCLGPLGQSGDLPVVGDWTGAGTARIGVFRALTGMWELDVDGNGVFDGCGVDRCLGPLGQPGDLVVVGDW